MSSNTTKHAEIHRKESLTLILDIVYFLFLIYKGIFLIFQVNLICDLSERCDGEYVMRGSVEKDQTAKR